MRRALLIKSLILIALFKKMMVDPLLSLFFSFIRIGIFQVKANIRSDPGEEIHRVYQGPFNILPPVCFTLFYKSNFCDRFRQQQ